MDQEACAQVLFPEQSIDRWLSEGAIHIRAQKARTGVRRPSHLATEPLTDVKAFRMQILLILITITIFAMVCPFTRA